VVMDGVAWTYFLKTSVTYLVAYCYSETLFPNYDFVWWERLPAANVASVSAARIYRGWKPLPHCYEHTIKMHYGRFFSESTAGTLKRLLWIRCQANSPPMKNTPIRSLTTPGIINIKATAIITTRRSTLTGKR
jgi:hypothetical protein